MPLILDSGRPVENLQDFTEAMTVGRSVVVTHSEWPDPLRKAAAEDLRKAREMADSPLTPEGKLVVFTSGSSGQPRAVVRSQESWKASTEAFGQLMGMSEHEVVWVPGPLSSTLSLYGAWHARSAGHEVVLGYRPHPAKLGHVTIAHVVPAVLRSIAEAHTAGMVPRLRTIVVAGDHVPPHARLGWEQRGIRLLEYYGAAELSFTGWRSEASFTAFPGARVDIRDGLLWVNSPFLSEGYLTPDPSAPFRLEDGWATVGDHAEWADPSSNTFEVLGRGDTAVTTGGFTVTVAGVEAHLRQVPGVDEVVVTGVPSPRLGEIVVAVLTGTPDWSQVRDVVDNLPAEARPRRWARPDTLPRLPGGKLDRAMIKVALLDGALPTGPLPSA